MCGEPGGALAGRALAGVAPGDHFCVTTASEDDHREALIRFARDAWARDARLLYLAHTTDEGTVRSWLDDAGLDSASRLDGGALELGAAAGAYGDGGFDPERQIDAFDAERRRARQDGYSALAVMGEMSWMLDAPEDFGRVLEYERGLGRIFAGADLVGACQFDRDVFPDDVLDDLVGAHAHRIWADGAATAASRGPVTVTERHGVPGVELSGEIDFDTAPYVAARIAEHLPGDEDIVIDARRLSFIDLTGCRILVQASMKLEQGRFLVLLDPPDYVRRLLSICGWLDCPQLAVVSGANGHGRAEG